MRTVGGGPESPQVVSLPSSVTGDSVGSAGSASLTAVSCPTLDQCTATGVSTGASGAAYVLPILDGTPGTALPLGLTSTKRTGLYCSDAYDCLAAVSYEAGTVAVGSVKREVKGVWGAGPAGLAAGSAGSTAGGIKVGSVESFGCADATDCIAYVAARGGGAPFFITLAARQRTSAVQRSAHS